MLDDCTVCFQPRGDQSTNENLCNSILVGFKGVVAQPREAPAAHYVAVGRDKGYLSCDGEKRRTNEQAIAPSGDGRGEGRHQRSRQGRCIGAGQAGISQDGWRRGTMTKDIIPLKKGRGDGTLT